MNITVLKNLSLAATVLAAAVGSNCALAQTKFVTIGTGGVSGVYYAVGGALCRVVNRDRVSNGIRCSAEATPGSMVNIDSLKRNSINFAIVQGDLHYQAVKGDGAFAKNGVQENLRSVLSLYPEALTILSSKEISAKGLDDLKGRRFSLGMLGSGGRATIEKLLQASSLSASDFGSVVERAADEQGHALCENKIDGFAYVVGHPAPNVMRTIKECGAKFVAVESAGSAAVLRDFPYFVKTEIPGSLYPGLAGGVPTIGMLASLVTTDSVPDDMVYSVVKSIFGNIEELKGLNPSLARLDPRKMISEGLVAPIHPGAMRFYKEKGWL
jgi:TRAP transporter TAXI family solute receptor